MKNALWSLLAVLSFSVAAFAQAPVAEHDLSIGTYKFSNGQSLDKLSIHYATLGEPKTDAAGHIVNAVMILHGTSGSGKQFQGKGFAGVLFGPGQMLDSSKYFIILPDDVGHGRSSKPSDGLHAKFPEYNYADMVDLEHRLMQSLKIDRLRLLMGTSMGCMHAWMWLERYPGEVQAALPLACLPVEIAGRNRLWRKVAMDEIRKDPEWQGGEYKKAPHGLWTAEGILVIAAGSALDMQTRFPTREKADSFVDTATSSRMSNVDANDLWYALNASRDYDPSKDLEKITVPITAINFADDFINPPELGIFEKELARVKSAKAVLWPITPETRGHGTHTIPSVWQEELKKLMERSEKAVSD